MKTHSYRISAEQRLSYAADGVIHLPGVLDATWLQRLKSAMVKLTEREMRDGAPEGFFDRQRLWEIDLDFRNVVFNSPASSIAAQFLEVDTLNLLYDQAFIKAPASGVRTPWHNDLPNWPVRGEHLITVWVSLDPIGADNGMLEFARGSHRWGRWTPRPHTDIHGRITHFHIGEDEVGTQEEMQSDFARLEDEVAAADIVSWETSPGDAIVFGALMIHGAIGNNRSDLNRRAYSMRFAGPDVRYHPLTASNAGIMSEELADGDPLSGKQYPVVYRE